VLQVLTNTVWIGGDFSLPEINWKDLDNIHVKENSKNADIHQEFIELTTNWIKPTRGDNTLDLFRGTSSRYII
jgi:hypothetical protein